MAIYHEDIADIELESGNVHRSFLKHSIGSGDAAANRFGVRLFRGGVAESAGSVSCQGFFRNSQGENIALTSHGTVSGNVAYVTLPQACYNYDGPFTLSIKLVGGGVTGTMRIIDGVVDNTNTGSAVAPTGSVPTYQEILAVYAEMQEDIADYESVVANQNQQISDLNRALSSEKLFLMNVPTPSEGSTQLFTSSDVSVGDKIYYSISTGALSPSGYNVYIQLLDVNDKVIGNYGKTTIGTTDTIYSGSFTIPAGFAKANLQGTRTGSYLIYATDDKETYLQLVASELKKDCGYLAENVVTPSTGSTELFDLDDVLVGTEVSYAISIGTGAASGYNVYIELLDVNNKRIGVYGKTTVSTTATRYTGTFTIPTGFSKAVLNGTSVGSYLEYVKADTRKLLNSRINGIQNDIGYLAKGVMTSSSGTDLFTSDDVNVGETIQYSITMGTGSVSGYTAYIELLNASNVRLGIYGKSTIATTDTNYSGSFVIPVGFAKAILKGTSIGSYLDFARIDLFASATKNELSDVMTDIGLIAKNVFTPSTGSTELFDSDDAKTGDKVYYAISIGTGSAAGYTAYIELLNSSDERLAVYGKAVIAGSDTRYEGTFYLPEGFAKAVLKGTSIGSYLDYLRIEPTASKNNTHEVNTLEFVGDPVTIFENDDETAIEGIDDGLLNCVSVLKISDTMYYLYYEAYALNDNVYDTHLCFAYSTDGEHFTKGFPAGIDAPIEGTNLLFETGITQGQCVVKVQDSENPFRMIVLITEGQAYNVPAIYKSSDGVHWTKIRTLTTGDNDTPISCVVRGNLLKIFIRKFYGSTGRAVGIIYTDLDGNLVNYGVNNIITTENYSKQIYQPAASMIDDHREILIPTMYNENDYSQWIEVILLDGNNWTFKTVDTSKVVTSDVKSIYFGAGLVNIGLKTYAYYEDRDSDHEHYTPGTTKSAIRRIEVRITE